LAHDSLAAPWDVRVVDRLFREADDLAKDADAGPDDPPEFAEWLTTLRASPRASDQWRTRCTRSQIIWASPRKSDGVIGRPEVATAHAGKNPLLPAFTEKQIFDQGGGREKQDKDDQQPKQAHAPPSFRAIRQASRPSNFSASLA